MEGMDKIAKKPIKITDTTFRDGHQSSLASSGISSNFKVNISFTFLYIKLNQLIY